MEKCARNPLNETQHCYVDLRTLMTSSDEEVTGQKHGDGFVKPKSHGKRSPLASPGARSPKTSKKRGPKRLYQPEDKKSLVPQDKSGSTSAEDRISFGLDDFFDSSGRFIKNKTGRSHQLPPRTIPNNTPPKSSSKQLSEMARTVINKSTSEDRRGQVFRPAKTEDWMKWVLQKYVDAPAGNDPTLRGTLNEEWRALKQDRIYHCVCNKVAYGFHAGCGLKDQLLALYNEYALEECLESGTSTPKLQPRKPTICCRSLACSKLIEQPAKPITAKSKKLEEQKPTNLIEVEIDLPEKLEQECAVEVPKSISSAKLFDAAKCCSSVDFAGSNVAAVATSNRFCGLADDVSNQSTNCDDCEEPLKITRRPRLYKRLFKDDSKFHFDALVNHQIGALERNKDQSHLRHMAIPDSIMIPSLYSYLRRREFDSYTDRAEKLAHMTKLATKWENETFDDKKLDNVIGPIDLNKYFATIQKVVDSQDTQFLLKPVNPDHERNRLRVWWRRKFTRLNK